jgi:broad specificity phosphatase PhoE
LMLKIVKHSVTWMMKDVISQKKIGDLFRSNGIDKAAVYSSQWCRCLDTAKLLDIGEVSKLPSLNSFFEHFERERSQTEKTIKWIQNAPLDIPTVLVSHQVNISALTGYSPASGEIVFLRRLSDGSTSVIGSIQTLNWIQIKFFNTFLEKLKERADF